MQSLAVQKFGQFVYREKSADVVEKFVFRATRGHDKGHR